MTSHTQHEDKDDISGRHALLRVRRRLFHIMHKPVFENRVARYVNYMLALLILANCADVALETMPSMKEYHDGYVLLDAFSLVVFLIEYALRIWVCVEQPRFSHPVLGRLNYARQPLTLIDAVVLVSMVSGGIDLRFLRVFRLSRLLQVFHLESLDKSLNRFMHALGRRRTLLIVSVTLMLIAMYCSASIMYYAEHEAQPQKFVSIPSTLWWSVVSLSTTGYGDQFPISSVGKFFASLIIIFGTGIFALPAAIVTASVLEATNTHIDTEEELAQDSLAPYCPHCGAKRATVKESERVTSS